MTNYYDKFFFWIVPSLRKLVKLDQYSILAMYDSSIWRIFPIFSKFPDISGLGQIFTFIDFLFQLIN